MYNVKTGRMWQNTVLETNETSFKSIFESGVYGGKYNFTLSTTEDIHNMAFAHYQIRPPSTPHQLMVWHDNADDDLYYVTWNYKSGLAPLLQKK